MATSLACPQACPQSRVLCKSRIGEVFRSGCTFTRGYGKIFYFQPGHETNGSFHNPYVRRIIQNAVHWCYNDKNRRITLGAPSIEVTLEQARLEGNTGEYLKMWD